MTTFQITGWDETTTYEGQDGAKQSQAKVSQTYTGELEGSSEVNYAMSYLNGAYADFSGFEIFIGSYLGKAGTFVLKHTGSFDKGVAASEFVVVAGSATGQLQGLTGTGRFASTESGQANCELSFTLP